jgi:Tfp pilus assembly protein PilF
MNIVNGTMLRVMVAVLFLALCLMTGCTSPPRVPESILDTPQHHTSSGFKLLEKGYLFDAKREFQLALQLDPDYSDAHRGLALTCGREHQFAPAFESMRLARDTAKTDREKALAYVGFMRLYILEQGEHWLDKTKARFVDALNCQKDLSDAYFYMGIAYKLSDRPQEATEAFKKVLEIDNGLVTDAENELKSLLPPT